MDMNDVIKKKIEEFVTKNLMFTSVDIANSIKEENNLIRNFEVAEWLRNNLTILFPTYKSTRIYVMNGQYLANLYHLIGTDADDYQHRNQKALSPKISNQQNQMIVQNDDDDKIIISSDSQNRIRIPASLVKKLGWNPGNSVDKNRILVNNEDIPDNLIVQSDGKIAFQRKCIAWDNDPIKVFINNNNLCFEKA